MDCRPIAAAGTGARPKVLLTAQEAYPEFERLFLSARTEIWGSFLVFDPQTRLRSAEARQIGATWFDLIEHTLRRGVSITMVISDVDPAMRAAMHRDTWRAVRLFHAAAELAGAHDRLRVIPAMHASETGLVPRLLFWPVILRRLHRTAAWLNRLSPAARVAVLREMPGVARRMRIGTGGRVRPRFWPVPRLFPGTHHQKLAVFDRSTLYIGGLDLDERRYDSPDHGQAPDQTWHDIQLRIDGGPAVQAAQDHLETFLGTIEGRDAPPPQSGLLRTLSRKRRFQPLHLGPEPMLSELRDAHLAAVGGAQRLIYLETQFFRDRTLARSLADAARRKPDLSLILMLPGAPDDLAFRRKTGIDVRGGEWLQSRCIRTLVSAFGARLFVGCPAQRRRWASDHPLGRDGLHGAPIIYVHAKLSVFDDRTAIVSSANLNGRSMKWDTEAGVQLDDPATVRALRHRAMAHWLPPDAAPGYLDPARAVRLWRDLALRNAALPPEARSGFVVPYDLRVAERDGHAVPLLPEELV
ncbi:MAG: phospholipase [Paracoccaceae bacterium]|nr:MAG: phospholipase [Paracoccaceae bacterium]